jgi:hypothetical protein
MELSVRCKYVSASYDKFFKHGFARIKCHNGVIIHILLRIQSEILSAESRMKRRYVRGVVYNFLKGFAKVSGSWEFFLG